MNNAHDLLERWFSSDAWTSICNEEDDPDSIELMETISDHLASLIFHINNNSGQDRIDYELRYFVDLCNNFEIPLY